MDKEVAKERLGAPAIGVGTLTGFGVLVRLARGGRAAADEPRNFGIPWPMFHVAHGSTMPHPEKSLDTAIYFSAPAEVETPNHRTTWGHRAAISSRVREAIRYAVKDIPSPTFDNIQVLITRVGANILDDDNLVAACKPARDEIAHWLGLDDADERIRFTYDQRQERVVDETPRPRRHFRTWLEVTVSPGVDVAPPRALGAPARLERERTKAPVRVDADPSTPAWETSLRARPNGTRVCVAYMNDVHGQRIRVCTRFTQQGHAWRTTGVALELNEAKELGEAIAAALAQAGGSELTQARSLVGEAAPLATPPPGSISCASGTGGGTDTPPKFGRNTERVFPDPHKPPHAPKVVKHLNPKPPPIPKPPKPPPYPRVRTPQAEDEDKAGEK